MSKSINGIKKLSLLLFVLFGMFMVSASSNIVDVVFSENAYEYVTYNPSITGLGTYYDPNENQSVYTLSGNITIRNTDSTQSIQNLVLNVSTQNVYNMAYLSGNTAYVTSVNTNSNYTILTIPDLGAGQSVVFTYSINTSRVAPPLNFTSSYADNKVFSGLPLKITDKVQNRLNSTLYPVNCIYSINITQNAMIATVNSNQYNFSFISTSTAGSDAGNVTYNTANTTIYWNTLAGACLNSNANTNVNYDMLAPTGIPVAGDYKFMNATIKYNLNATVSRATLNSINALLDVDPTFDKYMNNTLTGDNATWKITAQVMNPTNITVNLTRVTLWVSVRNGTGTGFTNPSLIDNDTISGSSLTTVFNPNVLLDNNSINWNNSANPWYFNYTFSSSPIVWMNLQNSIVNDGVQLTNRSVTYGNNMIYVKEVYVATGYWLQVNKTITRLAEGNYTIVVTVLNRGTSPTPSGQVVMVYNFIPNTFNLTGPMYFSSSAWYTTTSANQTLADPTYNGTMYQFGLLPNGNPYTSSLDSFGAGVNGNNTWTVTYNVSGSGQFRFDDLFLSGVDPLNVQEYGATKGLSIESVYGFVSSKIEYVLVGVAAAVGVLLFLF